jgi:hypothetical protein
VFSICRYPKGIITFERKVIFEEVHVNVFLAKIHN